MIGGIKVNSPHIRVFLLLTVGTVVTALPSPLAAQRANAIDVTDSRPLCAAFDALEITFGVPINYEDPPYENEADLQDVSTQQQRAANPGYRLLVPRSGHIHADVRPPGAATAMTGDAVADVNLLLSIYRQNSLPGDFKVEQANGMIYVSPIKVLGATGTMRDVTSPMLTPVTVPYAQRTVVDTAQAIFDSLAQASGLTIVIGSFPFWPTDMVTFGVSGLPARDALANLFSQAGKGVFSYRLLFDPRPDSMRVFDYMINVQRTGYVSPPLPGSSAPPTTPQTPAGNRPGLNPVNQ
jgi:hypothetical protein